MKGLVLKLLAAAGAAAAIFYLADFRRPVFADSFRQGDYLWHTAAKIDQIELGGIRLQKKDGLWRLGTYYADSSRIGNFIGELRQTVYQRQLSEKLTCVQPLTLWQKKQKILDVCLSSPTIEGVGRIIVGKDNYAVSRNLMQNNEPSAWLLQTLQPLAVFRIEKSNFNDSQVWNSANLYFLKAQDYLPQENMQRKGLKIITTDGIIINGAIYRAEEGYYWLRLGLELTVMPRKEAAEFVKNNDFLYRGWYFELAPKEGSRLYEALI